jgi:hypothetical protein
VSTDITKPVQRKNVFQRLGDVFWEKLQDEQVREAIQTRAIPRWYHRLNPRFDGPEPRLDEADKIPEMKQIAEDDDSLSSLIGNAADCLIASLFYFKLEANPERWEGKFVCSGHILCSLSKNDEGFQELMDRLLTESAQFLLDDYPIGLVNHPSCFGKDGNFKKRIELITAGRFTISLKRGSSEVWNISRSPFTLESLKKDQGFDISFGRPDHRKRKASNDFDRPGKKRRLS